MIPCKLYVCHTPLTINNFPKKTINNFPLVGYLGHSSVYLPLATSTKSHETRRKKWEQCKWRFQKSHEICPSVYQFIYVRDWHCSQEGNEISIDTRKRLFCVTKLSILQRSAQKKCTLSLTHAPCHIFDFKAKYPNQETAWKYC